MPSVKPFIARFMPGFMTDMAMFACWLLRGDFHVCFLGEFALLIAFRVVGADDLQARQVLTRDAVQVVRQRLHLLHARHGVEHDEDQQHTHERNHAACQQ